MNDRRLKGIESVAEDRVTERKSILLRLDPAVYDALSRWAADELRSTTAQIEFLLRRALVDAGRMPASAGGMRRRGRPPKAPLRLDEDALGRAGAFDSSSE